MSLGQNGSFFAVDNQGHRWRNIPESCCDYYQKYTRADLFAKSRINSVDIGHNGSYLGIGVDNRWFWNLGNEYPALSLMVQQKGITSCVRLLFYLSSLAIDSLILEDFSTTAVSRCADLPSSLSQDLCDHQPICFESTFRRLRRWYSTLVFTSSLGFGYASSFPEVCERDEHANHIRGPDCAILPVSAATISLQQNVSPTIFQYQLYTTASNVAADGFISGRLIA